MASTLVDSEGGLRKFINPIVVQWQDESGRLETNSIISNYKTDNYTVYGQLASTGDIACLASKSLRTEHLSPQGHIYSNSD